MLQSLVDSSNVNRVGWDNGTLYVDFHKTGTYSYAGVPLDVYNEFIAAPSAGKFFIAEVKGKFAHEVCTDPVFDAVSL